MYFGLWWVVVDIFWLMVGGGGWRWMVVGGGIVYSNPNLNASITKRVSNKKFKRIFHHFKGLSMKQITHNFFWKVRIRLSVII